MAQKVAVSIEKSATREEFTHYLHKDNIEVEFNKDSLLFLLPDGKKCGSDKLLSYGDFTKENIDKYIEYNDTLLDLGVSNPAIMYDAIELASSILNYNDKEQMQNKYFSKIQFSALEGQALREAIIELKKGGNTSLNRQQGNEIHKNSTSPNLLKTVNEVLEMALKEKYQQDQSKQYEKKIEYDKEQDEWEL